MKEIFEYIEKSRAQDLADQAIHANLLAAGWAEKDISEAFASFKAAEPAPPYPPPTAAPPTQPRKRSKSLVLGITALLILILAAAGYIFYGKFAFSPEKLWEQALAHAQNQQSGKIQFAVTYKETLPENTDSINEADLAGNFTLSANGSTSLQKAGTVHNTEIKAKVNIELADSNVGFDVETRKIGSTVYYKASNDILSGFSAGLGETTGGSPGQWYRQTAGQAASLQRALKTLEQIQLALLRTDFLTNAKYLGNEEIDGQPSAHFQAAVDREKLAKYFADTTQMAVVRKLDFEAVEIWIGRKDKLIRRSVIKSNFPAFFAGLLMPEKNPSNPRDEQRLTDISEITSLLAQYKAANNRYPLAKNGAPDLPGEPIFAPKPPDGSCTQEQNLYWYEPSADRLTYQLKFCLGQITEGYEAGVHTASETGITPPPEPQNQTVDLPLSSKLELTLDFPAAGEATNITAPENAIDVNEIQDIQGAQEIFLGK